MTMLTPGMLKDRTTTTNHPARRRQGAFQRLRASLTAGRRPTTTAGRPDGTLLHDVALGGTAASAANRFLKTLATGRRA
jgi:hypothetical protein